MNSKFLYLSLLAFTLFHRSLSTICDKDEDFNGHYACGEGCTGTPSCGKRRCGNVDNMCYCECKFFLDQSICKTSELGYKWNGGILKKDGSYALNGTKGDGRAYKC
jgi:hypothetical protein